MNRFLLFFVLIINTICFAQNDNILAKKGMIVLEDNKHIPYSNIKLMNGNFRYNDENGVEKEISFKDVMYVEDEQNSKVFTNKALVERFRVKEEKRIAEEKQLTAERNLKNEQERARLEEERKLKLVPDGIYYTKEDFLNKKPNSLEAIIPKELIWFEKSEINGIPDACFFYSKQEDKKIKKVFAISYQGHLYFQIQAILSNRHKTDRAQTNDFPNGFTRVLSAGQNYYYVEADLVNGWAQGFAYGGIGGAAGAVIADQMHNMKGIVWDVKNKEFNIFKNCKDYNEFIKAIYPDGIQECEKHQPDITKIREVIEKIK